MKKYFSKLFMIMAVVMTTVVCFAFTASAETYTGECGAYGYELSYSFDTETGVMTVSGEGKMSDDLWNNYESQIVEIVIEEGVTSVAQYAFNSCELLEKVSLPDTLTEIGFEAFGSCPNLKEVTFGSSLVKIYGNAFTNCDSLREIIIPDSVEEIGNSAFYGCEGLRYVKIGDGVVKIDQAAFGWCTNLENVDLGASVTEIGLGAFMRTRLSYIKIPAATVSIGEKAFLDCILECIIVDDNNQYYCSENGVLFNKDKTVLLHYPEQKDSEYYAIPHTVTSIYNGSFNDIYSIKTVTIPAGLTDLGENPFQFCWQLENIYVDDSNTIYSDDNGILFNKDKTHLIKYPEAKNLDSYAIPQGVIEIKSTAFANHQYIKYITIPDSVVVIGAEAFRSTYSLTGIVIPDSVTEIGESAFSGSGISSVEIGKGIKKIGDRFFSGTNLSDVVIPEGIEEIEWEAFAHCWYLTSVTIPESVTYIAVGAFEECDKIKNVYYSGYDYQWENIVIEEDNENLTDATLYCKICSHEDTAAADGTEAGCTVEGYTAGVYCNVCERWIEGHQIIEAEGHTDADADGICENCGKKTNDIFADETISTDVESGEIKYLKFIPDISGVYEFLSVSDIDTIGYLFDADKNRIIRNDDYEEDTDFFISCSLIAGETYYFGVSAYSNGACDVKLVCKSVIHSHSYTSTITKAPTCTETGIKTFTCSCSDTYTETVENLGHSYASSYTVDKEATCSAEGSKSKHCTRSGCTAKTSVTAISKLAHTYTNACDTTCNECGVKRSINHSYTNSCDESCNNCGTTRSINHTYKTTTTKATLKKSGKQVTKCTVCGEVESSKTIYYPKTIKLSASTYTYNGKAKTPSVVVKDSKGNTLKKDTDYTVKYASGRKNPGKYTVTVTFKGKYSGTKKLTYTIKPKAVTLSKLTAGSKQLTATWKTATAVTGYEVMYSTSSKFTSKTTKKTTVKSAKTKKTTIKKLTKGKKYYVKVRAYKTVDGKKIYGSWSKVKSVKIK